MHRQNSPSLQNASYHFGRGADQWFFVRSQKRQNHSLSYFKHTVYGLRFLFRIYELKDQAIKLPSLKKKHTLPVVLSVAEVKRLLSTPKLLKHRVLIGLIYSSGLRLKKCVFYSNPISILIE